MKLTIIGVGPGREEFLTQRAAELIRTSKVVFAPDRIFDSLSFLNPGIEAMPFSKILERLQEMEEEKEENVALLASGDVGFYSVSSTIKRKFPGMKVELVNGLSSLQYFCGLLQIPYEEMHIVSAHGRKLPVLPHVAYHKRTFFLTGGQLCAHDIIQELSEGGLGEAKVSVGENLSLPGERIRRGAAWELAGEEFCALAVMVVENPAAVNPFQELRDSDFLRSKVPMTKEDIRSVSLARLDIQPQDSVYDIGAGTGAMSVAMARRAWQGMVYAVERNEDACRLVLENRERLGAFNLRLSQGTAPEALEELPPPDKVFIGGSGGNMREILELVWQKNPEAKIVINAITLETLQEGIQCLEEHGLWARVTCVSSTQGEQVGSYHMMKAQNPVYIISGEPGRNKE